MNTTLRRTASAALGLAAILGSAAGCYKATFYRDPSVVRADEHERWSDFFLFGLVGTESLDVTEFCAGRQVAQVKTGGNFGTGIIGVLTIGIYTPRKVYVTCAAQSGTGPSASQRTFEIDANAAGEPVRVRWDDGRSVVTSRVETAGNQVWRVSRASEVRP